MRKIATLTAHLGNYLVSLSDRTRLQIVLLGLLLLGGGGVYKLVVNIRNLEKPLPAASPDALIKPMQQLIQQTSAEASAYQQSRQRDTKQLDSLNKMYYNQTRPRR